MATPPDMVTSDLTTHALYRLAAGQFRDKHYAVWSLFDPWGQPRLSYPLTAHPQPHGKALIPPEDLQAVNSGKEFVSAVYFDPKTTRLPWICMHQWRQHHPRSSSVVSAQRSTWTTCRTSLRATVGQMARGVMPFCLTRMGCASLMQRHRSFLPP